MHLTVIQLWQTRCREPLWHLRTQDLGLKLVSEQLVVNVPTDTAFVECKRLHGGLHSVKGRGFPDVIYLEAVGAVRGDIVVTSQLESDLVGNVCETSARDHERKRATHCSGS